MNVVVPFALNTLANFVVGLLVAKFLGPDEYGRFALALGAGIVVQTALFDWIKLAATRFYSDRSRVEAPGIRATLDYAFATLAVAVTAGAAILLFAGFDFALSPGLAAAAVAIAVVNGMFDYHTALVRARFLNRVYARLLVVKSVCALLLTGGGALVFGSAQMALTGACLSLAGSVFTSRVALRDEAATPDRAARPIAMDFARYALPIVGANVIYALLGLTNRALVTRGYGFAETGQYSLAYDIGLRIVSAIGSTMDVLLFQIAVAAADRDGMEAARKQIAGNMAIVFAVLLPSCVGLWLTLPSIQALIVPAQYRGPFAHYLALLLPGLLCIVLVQFALNPVFQIRKRTLPLVVCALLSCGADALLGAVLPAARDASGIALAQSGAFVVSLASLVGFAMIARAVWPPLWDFFAALVGTGLMASALLSLQGLAPGALTLGLQIALGGGLYAGFVAVFDVAGIRSGLGDVFRTHPFSRAKRQLAKPQG